MYRIQSPKFPINDNSLNFKMLSNPVLQTGEDGKYTTQLSNCVSDCKSMEAGIYIIILSTFNPQQLATYDFAIFSSAQIEYQKYQ